MMNINSFEKIKLFTYKLKNVNNKDRKNLRINIHHAWV